MFNIAWIVFCAAMIEMTLHKNNMIAELAGGSNIAYPGQLIPLLVGILSFLRTVWLIFKEWREDRYRKALHDPEAPPSKTGLLAAVPNIQHHGKKSDERVVLKTQAPDFQNEKPIFESSLMRYILAWLPWLAELVKEVEHFRDTPATGAGKSPLPQTEDVIPQIEEDIPQTEDVKHESTISQEIEEA
jgi:hypothetical protein